MRRRYQRPRVLNTFGVEITPLQVVITQVDATVQDRDTAMQVFTCCANATWVKFEMEMPRA